MGNKISGKPGQMGGPGGGGSGSGAASSNQPMTPNVGRHHPHHQPQSGGHHHHQNYTGSAGYGYGGGSGGATAASATGTGVGGGGGGGMNQFATGRSNQVLRLWAEVFHVSASSGAVRWNQISDDLVPVSVSAVNNKFHVTAFNSRVDKVLDTWLTATRLGQASNCFVYWKDNVSGDTWGLNFTSAADARAFRDCIASTPSQQATDGQQHPQKGPKRAESSYSLRDGQQPSQSKAGSGAHLTTKYYAQRATLSTPNSPSKRRIHQANQMQAQVAYQQTAAAVAAAQAAAAASAASSTDPNVAQCTCDCLTAEALHKQRNGRIRYANFTRQDSGGTTQSSRSDGSLVRRQGERQQQFYRQSSKSIEEAQRSRVQSVSSGAGGKTPLNKRVAALQGQRILLQNQEQALLLQQQQLQQQQNIQQQRAIVHANAMENPRAQSAPDSRAGGHLVSTATTTDDLDPQQQSSRRSQRPKSLVALDGMGDSGRVRDRTHRSLEGRRRSLERMQCVDLTDASPPTPARSSHHSRSATTPTGDQSVNTPSAAQLDEYERELRRRLLLTGGDSIQGNQPGGDALETFESLLKESMDDVATLMREVQQELTLIRAEERRFQSQSTQSLHRIGGGGPSSLPRRSPIAWDTLSIDGQLPFLPSFASLPSASSAYHNAYTSGAYDARAGYLTGSEYSDDDRASLTTAVSDDEDGPIVPTLKSPKTGVTSFECFGSVRKSGFLSVKKWLIRKRHTLELARKRGWKGYWVCLKGTTLLFYSCESAAAAVSGCATPEGTRPNSSAAMSSAGEMTPKHLIFVEACLVQPLPEHPRRDNVFCLSTSFGDAYLFDATSLPERDEWIQALHTACAAQIARNSGKLSTLHYINEEQQRLERLVELDMESKQEAEVLLACAGEEKQKQQLVSHVMLLEEKIERNRLEIFRLKSYFGALNGNAEDGPNPKSLLSQASRRSKSQLNRIGVFTVSSLHAFNCAKNPQPLEKLQRRDSFSADYIRELYSPSQAEVPVFASNSRIILQVLLLTGEQKSLEVPANWTAEQVLNDIFGPGPECREYFLRCADTGAVLYRNDLAENYRNHSLIVCPKILFTIDFVRDSNDSLFGFSVESELSSNSDLRVFVMRVEGNSIAALHGLCRHDEIMVINGALVQELDMMFIESVLQEELSLSLMIRSSRTEVPVMGIVGPGGTIITKSETPQNLTIPTGASFDNEKTNSVTDEFIESLVCPPPPSSDFSQLILSDTQLSKYIVPKVDNFLPGELASKIATVLQQNSTGPELPTPGGFNEELVYGSTDSSSAQVHGITKKTPSNPVVHMQKLIRELLDTESTYCQSLEQLVKLYLEPLSQNNFLTQTDVKVLFGSILQIIDAQNEFRSELQEVGEHILGECSEMLDKNPNLTHMSGLQELGVGYIADCFLKHCSNFRNYSTFCASHARAVKLMADEKTALYEWLQKRASGQIAQSLESYLIRPIQRVLKYPLLLSQMKALCAKGTVNHNKLEDALKELEKVAEHINEMQRIHEEYGAIFEHLARSHARSGSGSNGPTMAINGLVDLSPTALMHYGNVDWCNSMEFLGKNCRKGVELNSVCFVFRQFVVFLCKETIRHRKRMPTARTSDVEIIRHQVLIPVIEVQVRASPQSDNETDFRWDLIQLKMNSGKRSEKIYKLSNDTNEQRNQFLRTIRQIIREDVRQMNILGFNPPKSNKSRN